MKYVRLHTINILMHNNDVLTRIFSINAYNIQLWDAMLTIAQTESVTGTEVFKTPGSVQLGPQHSQGHPKV